MIQNRQSGKSGLKFMLDRKRVRLGIPVDDLQLIWSVLLHPPNLHRVSVFPLYFQIAFKGCGVVYIFINVGSFRYKSTFLCVVKVCVKIRLWFISRFAEFVFYMLRKSERWKKTYSFIELGNSLKINDFCLEQIA